MGHARYVGRVGALAVALGVGVAVASSPGVAWAIPTDPGSTSTDGRAPASQGTDDTPTVGAQQQTEAGPPSSSYNPPDTTTDAGVTPGGATTSGTTSTTDLGAGVVISAQSSTAGGTTGKKFTTSKKSKKTPVAGSTSATTAPRKVFNLPSRGSVSSSALARQSSAAAHATAAAPFGLGDGAARRAQRGLRHPTVTDGVDRPPCGGLIGSCPGHRHLRRVERGVGGAVRWRPWYAGGVPGDVGARRRRAPPVRPGQCGRGCGDRCPRCGRHFPVGGSYWRREPGAHHEILCAQRESQHRGRQGFGEGYR